jgi:hypothetical protein
VQPVMVQLFVPAVHLSAQPLPGQSSVHESEPVQSTLHPPPGHDSEHEAPAPQVSAQLPPFSPPQVSSQSSVPHWHATPATQVLESSPQPAQTSPPNHNSIIKAKPLRIAMLLSFSRRDLAPRNPASRQAHSPFAQHRR